MPIDFIVKNAYYYNIQMKLVIVESPTKAKTISKFLGKDFEVKSSYGHVRDLPQKDLGVDIKKNFQPDYVIPDKAKSRVKELKSLAKKSELTVLATDEDREGEAIAWHLIHALGLKTDKIQRIAFHEITKNAVQKALVNPRKIDINLVDAQQARRILDRLVGYKLSPFLWKKIRKGLSAGRVQSVAVRLIVEREREIENFKHQEYWEIEARLKKGKTEAFRARLWKENGKLVKKLDINSKQRAEQIKKKLEHSVFVVDKITKKEILRNPPAPFTTSTLQQAAGSQLGYSPKQTMRLAQQLYEGVKIGKDHLGLITYMRTDSVNLSSESLVSAQKTIEKLFGREYRLDMPRIYKTKSKGAQEAHEAIRPTFIEKDPESIRKYLDPKHYKLYRLIWNRTVASQMAPARIDSTTVEISATPKANLSKASENLVLRASGSVIKFDSYLKLSASKQEDNLLPDLAEKDNLELIAINADQKFTQPPARYSEPALVKVLEENGIGRPSTYAPTISTIQERGYVEKDENKKLFPTEIGFLVNDVLVKHFGRIVDYKFTAKIEDTLDAVAQGKEDWHKAIAEYYEPFEKNLKEKTAEVKKEDFQTKLGRKCPECGSELIEKFGRYGKFIACGNYPKCKYTERSLEEKKQEQEILKSEADKNGQVLCDKCGAPMTLKRGPYGPFFGCSRYPKCKNIKKIENKTGVKCPLCGKDIVERKSKKGRLFYGCSGYPDCQFVMWGKPTGKKCPKCGNLLTYGPKETIKCSNKECAYTKSNT